MNKTSRLEDKIRLEIQHWFDTGGAEFITCIKEFCQGNRSSLAQIMKMVRELGTRVFVGEGETLNKDLLESLEYKIFDLIGKFSSTPGGISLERAIHADIVEYLIEIFTEAKKRWNLINYKVAVSYEELDPHNSLIPAPNDYSDRDNILEVEFNEGKSRRQARLFLDEMVLFAKKKLRGEKNRKIAVNWLENPEKYRDFNWLASLTGSSTGSVKVTLTRLKHTLARNYCLKHEGNELVLNKSDNVNAPRPANV